MTNEGIYVNGAGSTSHVVGTSALHGYITYGTDEEALLHKHRFECRGGRSFSRQATSTYLRVDSSTSPVHHRSPQTHELAFLYAMA